MKMVYSAHRWEPRPYEMIALTMNSHCCSLSGDIFEATSPKSIEDAELFDPARFPHRTYLENQLCRDAVAKEINDLLPPGKGGICP